MSDAGVAGEGRWPWACRFGDLFAKIAGEGFAEFGLGGGPIKASESGSGDMESVDELA